MTPKEKRQMRGHLQAARAARDEWLSLDENDPHAADAYSAMNRHLAMAIDLAPRETIATAIGWDEIQ